MTEMRLQKYLSDLGISSRRKTEEWIKLGLVSINGEIIREPGNKIDPDKDRIKLDSSLRKGIKYYYYFFNKPKGVVTVNPQYGDTCINDLANVPEDVVPVGRLDKDSEGLIFLTNDGVVARRLMEPDFFHEKEYLVTVHRSVKPAELKILSQSIYIHGQKTRPAKVKLITPKKISVVLTEGKNRQIRRMCRQTNLKVLSLVRTRILSFQLGALRSGKLRKLSDTELALLNNKLGLGSRQRMLDELLN